ncbi:heat-inducible transcriptional repressor HrcA [Polyangium jinanense]|uniref:Heat-inducible transcription repressor HrcA n=1 Tax=Polyangium jinanense TaxID=2829994 RepID=A0A9X3X0U4_9BACT|nr:heat-inducible transcriptional repressor HrcA [Polyangium jinanense]MDC3953573.1 heat-inducible transcription repressor HrcA [Polyangium jinanense]MDC3979306.1 heat-inducible transcription repressor HrcA [Polyangium jinanense]
MSDLTNRSRKILLAVVTEFISTGAAVGSRTLARKYGLDLSAASVRNVLADLEEAGYLKQPHTSAGRVPTDRALRLFIDTLVQARAYSPEEQAKLGQRFAEIYAVATDPMREAGRYLSELSGTAAVIASPRTELRALSQLRFIPTRPGQLLAVLVFSDGTVENRFIQIEEVPAEPELTRIHNLLADVIEGRSLGEARDLFARRLADERIALDALRRRAFELGRRATADVNRRGGDVVIEGQGKLIDLPEYADASRLKKLLRTLTEREDLLTLLDKVIAAGAVTVFVGSEAGELGEGDLSLVVAPYTEHGRVAGTVGVLGPTRMDYAKVMPLVDATATAMSEALGGRRGSS